MRRAEVAADDDVPLAAQVPVSQGFGPDAGAEALAAFVRLGLGLLRPQAPARRQDAHQAKHESGEEVHCPSLHNAGSRAGVPVAGATGLDVGGLPESKCQS